MSDEKKRDTKRAHERNILHIYFKIIALKFK